MADSGNDENMRDAAAMKDFVQRIFQVLAGRNPLPQEAQWACELGESQDRDPVALLGNLIYQYKGGIDRLPLRALIESADLYSRHFQPQGEPLAAFLNVVDGALSACEHRAAMAGLARAGDGSAAVWALNPLDYDPAILELAVLVRAAPPDGAVQLRINEAEIASGVTLEAGFSIHRIRLDQPCKPGDTVSLEVAGAKGKWVLADDGVISEDLIQSSLARLQRDPPPSSVPERKGCFLNRYRLAARLPASDSINADHWPIQNHLAIYRTMRRLSPDLIVEDNYVRVLSQITTVDHFEGPLIFFLEFWKDRRSGVFAQLKSAERWRRSAAIADRIMPGGWRWLKLALDVDCASLREQPWLLHGLPVNRWMAHRLDKAGWNHAPLLSRSELAERLLTAAAHAIAARCGDKLVPRPWLDFIGEHLGNSDAADMLKAALAARHRPKKAAVRRAQSVAVIGETERSLGVVARSALQSLKAGPHPVHSRPAAGFIRGAVKLHDETGTILFCANAQRILDMYAAQYSALTARRTVAFPFWETTRLPDLQANALAQVDRVVTATHFVEQAVRNSLGPEADVVTVGLPIAAPKHIERLPGAGPFSFLSIGDVHSGLARKNMLGSIRAFQRAFPEAGDVRLVLKIRNIDEDHWGAGEDWPLIQEIAAADSRIDIVLGDLPADGYWAMVSRAHCFLSLHRGEGFGYGLAHSLFLGIPVIATDFSGPCDFCTPETSYLVPATLVPVPSEKMDQTVPLGDWAEPDLDAAAEQMRAVYADYDRALARAARGGETVNRLYGEDVFRQRLTAALEF